MPVCASAFQKPLAHVLFLRTSWHHAGTHTASTLIFSRWWITTMAQAHWLLCTTLFGFSTCISISENPPIQRAGLEWVCVSSLQRHCMAFLTRWGRGSPKAMTVSSHWAVWHLGLLVLWDKVGIVLYLKRRPWKSWSQAQRTQEREGSWESQENITRKSLQWKWLSVPKERLQQKPPLLLSLRAGPDCPWKAGTVTLESPAGRNTPPEQVALSLHTANSGCSCYTDAFQK